MTNDNYKSQDRTGLLEIIVKCAANAGKNVYDTGKYYVIAGIATMVIGCAGRSDYRFDDEYTKPEITNIIYSSLNESSGISNTKQLEEFVEEIKPKAFSEGMEVLHAPKTDWSKYKQNFLESASLAEYAAKNKLEVADVAEDCVTAMQLMQEAATYSEQVAAGQATDLIYDVISKGRHVYKDVEDRFTEDQKNSLESGVEERAYEAFLESLGSTPVRKIYGGVTETKDIIETRDMSFQDAGKKLTEILKRLNNDGFGGVTETKYMNFQDAETELTKILAERNGKYSDIVSQIDQHRDEFGFDKEYAGLEQALEYNLKIIEIFRPYEEGIFLSEAEQDDLGNDLDLGRQVHMSLGKGDLREIGRGIFDNKQYVVKLKNKEISLGDYMKSHMADIRSTMKSKHMFSADMADELRGEVAREITRLAHEGQLTVTDKRAANYFLLHNYVDAAQPAAGWETLTTWLADILFSIRNVNRHWSRKGLPNVPGETIAQALENMQRQRNGEPARNIVGPNGYARTAAVGDVLLQAGVILGGYKLLKNPSRGSSRTLGIFGGDNITNDAKKASGLIGK